MALLRGDVPVVAYYDDILKQLRFARQSDGTWRTEVVDDSYKVGETPSMVIGAGGLPIIAYHDDVRNLFKVAFAVPEASSLLAWSLLGAFGFGWGWCRRKRAK